MKNKKIAIHHLPKDVLDKIKIIKAGRRQWEKRVDRKQLHAIKKTAWRRAIESLAEIHNLSEKAAVLEGKSAHSKNPGKFLAETEELNEKIFFHRRQLKQFEKAALGPLGLIRAFRELEKEEWIRSRKHH